MGKHRDLGQMAAELLGSRYALSRKELGADARLAKSGMVFDTEVFEAAGLGQLCVMRMKAMGGLMKMETAVLVSRTKDVPLLNLDWVGAMGKETQIAELYDTMLTPWPEVQQAPFEKIRKRDEDLPEPEQKPHWYDEILYPCSYHKAGRKIGGRLSAAAEDYLKGFLKVLEEAPDCDPAEKQAKVTAFAERLFAEGGPAVDQMTKLFGRETAERMIVRVMYGKKD